MKKYPVVAIDGPAASGKSSVARKLAADIGFSFVNSGALYRAMTWGLLQSGRDMHDERGLAQACSDIDLSAGLADGVSWVAIDGEKVEDEVLESPEVNGAVSLAARVSEVRTLVVDHLRAFAREGALVMEGRDIGSVVFPATPWKYYIDASEEVRQRRRVAQGQTDNVSDRDKIDSSRKSAPLRVPDGAVVVDSSDLGIDEVVDCLVKDMHKRGFSREG